MRAERQRARQLRALFTAMRLSILNKQYIFNSCSLNSKLDYSRFTPWGNFTWYRRMSHIMKLVSLSQRLNEFLIYLFQDVQCLSNKWWNHLLFLIQIKNIIDMVSTPWSKDVSLSWCLGLLWILSCLFGRFRVLAGCLWVFGCTWFLSWILGACGWSCFWRFVATTVWYLFLTLRSWCYMENKQNSVFQVYYNRQSYHKLCPVTSKWCTCRILHVTYLLAFIYVLIYVPWAVNSVTMKRNPFEYQLMEYTCKPVHHVYWKVQNCNGIPAFLSLFQLHQIRNM